MRKKALNPVALLLGIMLLAVLVSGCDGGASSSASSAAPAESTASAGGDHKMALILSGPISDMSWNATAYNGLLEIEKMGAEISYQESVDNSTLTDAMNTYATGGFDLIFLSTNSFEEQALEAAKDYPDVTFMIINGGKGFEAGAKYVNPDIVVNSTMTGSMTDVNAAKETAKAMIDNDVTTIAPMADNASLGVLEAAQEGGIYAVASGRNQEEVAPDAVLISVVKDTAIAYKAAYEAYLGGDMASETYKMGAAEGVVFLSDWYAAADGIDQSIKDEVQQIYDDLAAGKITIDLG